MERKIKGPKRVRSLDISKTQAQRDYNCIISTNSGLRSRKIVVL